MLPIVDLLSFFLILFFSLPPSVIITCRYMLPIVDLLNHEPHALPLSTSGRGGVSLSWGEGEAAVGEGGPAVEMTIDRASSRTVWKVRI